MESKASKNQPSLADSRLWLEFAEQFLSKIRTRNLSCNFSSQGCLDQPKPLNLFNIPLVQKTLF